MNRATIYSFIVLLLGLQFQALDAKKKSLSFNQPSKPVKTTKKKPYVKKTIHEGLGKRSKKNGMIKTKSVSSHFKRSSKGGNTLVNAYSRSK
ncbi:MAG: hypothetical protein WC747_01585 [Candidatus Babeliales bacterium]|jgi:hypothetical protein